MSFESFSEAPGPLQGDPTLGKGIAYDPGSNIKAG